MRILTILLLFVSYSVVSETSNEKIAILSVTIREYGLGEMMGLLVVEIWMNIFHEEMVNTINLLMRL